MRRWWLTIVAPAMLAAAAAAGCATVPPAVPVVTPDGVRFTVVDPQASSMALAGSFNQWSVSAHPLTRGRSAGAWSVVVPLPPGEYLFMYVVNGTQWISPPLAEDYVDDGFGAKNGVVVVRPGER